MLWDDRIQELHDGGWIRHLFLSRPQQLPHQAVQFHTHQVDVPESCWQFRAVSSAEDAGRFRFFSECGLSVFSSATFKEDWGDQPGSYFAIAFTNPVWRPAAAEHIFMTTANAPHPMEQAVSRCTGNWPHLTLSYAPGVGEGRCQLIHGRLSQRMDEILAFVEYMDDAKLADLEGRLVPCWRTFTIRAAPGSLRGDIKIALKDLSTECPDLERLLADNRLPHFWTERRQLQEEGSPRMTVVEYYNYIMRREQRREAEIQSLMEDGKEWLRARHSATGRLLSFVPNSRGGEPSWVLRLVLVGLRNVLLHQSPELFARRDRNADDYADTDSESDVEGGAASSRGTPQLRPWILNRSEFHVTLLNYVLLRTPWTPGSARSAFSP